MSSTADAVLWLYRHHRAGTPVHWSAVSQRQRAAMVGAGLVSSPLGCLVLTERGLELARRLEAEA